MFSLHSVTEGTKVALKWLAIGTVVFFICYFIFKGLVVVKTMLFPTPPPPPTYAYGKLPAIHFPKSATTKKLTYALETLTGELPTVTASDGAALDKVRVYKMIVNTPNLLNLERAKDKIGALGFKANGAVVPEKQVADHVYVWSEVENLNRQVTMDIVSQDFSITSSYTTNSSILSAVGLPSEVVTKQYVMTFLQSMALLPDDLDPTKTTTELYTLNGISLIPATSFSRAQIIGVDLYQKNVDGLPIYYPSPPGSTMRFLVGGGDSGGSVVEGRFYHQSIDTSAEAQAIIATYPIKTSAEAYKELENNQAYIASYGGTTGNVKIQNVYLGYYIGEEKEAYLMPIIVFKGSDNFYAYVSAVKNSSIQPNAL